MPEGALIFGIVDPSSGLEAFQWHRGFAAANDHLFPRTWDQYKAFAANGQIISVRGADGNYVGLAYFNLQGGEWEVGGLMVSKAYRGKGVGSILMRLTLGHVLFEEDPLDRGEPIIAHVHSENQDPRPIIEHALRFRYRKPIEVNGAQFPGLRTDKNGIVHGHEFELTIPGSLYKLSNWCEAWKDTMKDGQPARIELRPGTTLEMWASAFREMACHHGS